MSDLFSALVNLKHLTLISMRESTPRDHFMSCPQLLNLNIRAAYISFCCVNATRSFHILSSIVEPKYQGHLHKLLLRPCHEIFHILSSIAEKQMYSIPTAIRYANIKSPSKAQIKTTTNKGKDTPMFIKKKKRKSRRIRRKNRGYVIEERNIMSRLCNRG